MTRIFQTTLFVIVGLSVSSSVYGQVRWFNPGNVGFWSGFGGWPQTGASTADQAYMLGMSQLIRSQGEYNEMTSRAYINYEEARSRYHENRKQWMATYFAMREENESRRAAKIRRATYSPEILAAAAHSGVPKPLGRDSLNPVTGMLIWPDALQDDIFREHRERVDQLMELRTVTSGGRETALAIYEESQEMINLLRSRIYELPANEYIAARKFLDSLAYTVRSSA